MDVFLSVCKLKGCFNFVLRLDYQNSLENNVS